MKQINILSLAGLALTLILSSCSVEQRVYMTGYNIQWENGKHVNNKQELVKNNSINEINSEKVITEPTVTPDAIAVTEQAETINTGTAQVSENNLIASTDNSIVNYLSHKQDLNKKISQHVVSEKLTKLAIKKIMKVQKHQSPAHTSGDAPFVLLIILCFIIPFVAVGLVTNWDITIVR